jgi:anthranilate synthase/aminodeoxychorismate synthase-like glutamine amidotransferase
VILLIDNYDSFVHNLARYLQRLGQETRVVRNDVLDVSQIKVSAPAAIVLSPGPCTPEVAGTSLEVVREFWREIPILGVCLGHQTIAAALGATIVRAREPMHGRTSPITHDERGVFSGLPNPLTVCRYHSLIVEESSLPEVFEVSARLADETIMAIRHRHRPVIGLQFHPESILTDGGYSILANFLGAAGLKAVTDVSQKQELVERPRVTSVPDSPVTF